jgi:hypothetical protein
MVNLVLFGLFLSCATPVYETNDDLMMQMIASGFYTGHPDGHLVFTNILAGWGLRFLYGAWGGCNWYFFYLLAVHYVALTVIAFLVVSRRGGWLFTLLYAGFFLVVESHILLHLQFTTTAFLAGTAGVLLVVDGLRPGLPAHWPKVTGGLALAGIMCLIREQAALLLVGMAGPFLCERFGRAGWRRLLGTGLAFAGIFLVLHGINRWAYERDPAWAEYSEYNHMRGEIHLTALEKFVPKATATVGWSENDGWMFSKFYYAEPEVYAGAPKMRHFLDELKRLAQAGPPPPGKFSIKSFILPFVFAEDTRSLMVLAMLNGAWCVLAAGTFRRRCLITLLVSYGLFVGFSFYLLATARLPERVAYNIPLFINAIALYWATGFGSLPAAASRPGWFKLSLTTGWRAKAWRWVGLVLVALWAGLYLTCLADLANSLWLANAGNRNLERVSHKILEPVRTLRPDQKTPILIALPCDSMLEQCTFFYPVSAKAPFFLVPYGWITHSPLFDQILDQHHLHPYSLSLVDREDIFFLMGAGWLEPLRIFYREHYGLDVRFDVCVNTDKMPQFKDCHLHLYQAHVVGAKTPVGARP